MSYDRPDVTKDLQIFIEDLNKQIEMQNQLVHAAIEEKREKKIFASLSSLYLRKTYHVILFLSCIICLGFAFIFSQLSKLLL